MQHLKNYQIDLPEAIRIGESNMEEMQFKPIKTSYVAVCVCKQGYGVWFSHINGGVRLIILTH